MCAVIEQKQLHSVNWVSFDLATAHFCRQRSFFLSFKVNAQSMAAQKLTPSNKRALAQVTALTLYCEVVIMFTLPESPKCLTKTSCDNWYTASWYTLASLAFGAVVGIIVKVFAVILAIQHSHIIVGETSKELSSKRPTRVGETSVDQWFVVETSCRRNVCTSFIRRRLRQKLRSDRWGISEHCCNFHA